LLQQATPFSYPAPLEPRWMTRCNRPDVNCFYVSTVTDSPSKVPAIAAAPIWYDARLRSHSNGMTAAGRAGNVWGLLNSPHALAVRFHQYKFLFLSFHNCRGRAPPSRGTRLVPGRVNSKTGHLKNTQFPCRGQSPEWERMTRGLCPIKNRTSGCVSVDRSTWATLSTYNTPTQLDGHSRISRPRYVDAIQRRTL